MDHESASDEEPEAYKDRAYKLEDEVDKTQREIEPMPMSFLSMPRNVPNGVLAALDIFAFAEDKALKDLYFMAYGVTLATEDRNGRPAYFHGDAQIRITEPMPGIIIDVPQRACSRAKKSRASPDPRR